MADQPREPLEAVLRRLKEEREAADTRYNDALTTLDRTLRPPAPLPRPAPGLDDHQIAALNEAWNILPAPPESSGWRRRLTGYIWRVVAPYLQRQLAFNSLLVDHVNRTAAAARDAHRAAEHVVDAVGERLWAHAEFESRLIAYLQQITAYVDTKDRDSGAAALVLNAALSGMAENVDKRMESLAAREHRYDARTAAIGAAQDELRATLGVVQQGFMTLKRAMESRAHDAPAGAAVPRAVETAADGAFSGALDAYKYVGFEDQFRGPRDVIRERLASYLPIFDGASDVLDVGCGRGEFLDLLAARGIAGRGIDLNHEMAEGCRARGLDVAEADAVGYLSTQADGSLGGIFAAQVVEHLQPGYLLRFLELAFHKLRPGGRLVLETLNPACWVAFFESYIRDITHVWPLHPETLKYLVVASGFTGAQIQFRSPVPEQDRLQPIAVSGGSDVALGDLAEAFNGNVEKLNARMFTYLDYAIVAER
jgi:SAM-dependent methyltransferase